ncbi:MAG: glycosyltransferase family 2 protein [Gemmatimonadota bacterium]
MNSIGLIVSTYNWPAALDRVLASIVGQTVLPGEVLVADDGSGPDTTALVAAWAARTSIPIIHVWQEDQGFRVARARNRALARASSDYLIFLDGDQVLDRHFVADHRRAARPGVVLRGSRSFLSPERTATVLATGKLPSWWQSGIRKRAAAMRLPWLAALLGSWRARHTEGHNIACWRADAVRINGFEERFEGWGGEDSEFVLRLLHAGLSKRRLRFGGVLYHLDHPPAARNLQRRNDGIYDETVSDSRIRAVVGLDQLGA